ncbi:alpha-mannosidase [Kineococcus rhizosphaerae]|uniref:Alpha-mannosidase n=1 Tax=Kineococcus rhizosphaerae TaxID=559628 RepID=A0A2T0R3G2_9ACTN|nr:glycoside hydrolase family 38 C-terminal domain-containing protein [Kineococcus rhizosphaerae]PRY14599.1 alpha-mannosidase [Kineococcus rhizosphaerae]
MHDDRSLVEGRVQRVLNHRIRPAVHPQRVPMTLSAWLVPDEPVPARDAVAALAEGRFGEFSVGTTWGRPWSTTWVRARAQVPAEWAGKRVEAQFDLGFVGDWPGNQAEALVHTLDGVPVKGVAPDNKIVPVVRDAQGGETVDWLLEMAANPDVMADDMRPTPLGDKSTAGEAHLYTMKVADLVVLDEEVWMLAVDVECLDDLMRHLPESEPRRYEIARALDRALDALDLDDVSGTATAARAELAGVLASPAVGSAHTLSSVGHAHIDSAWLWPLRETQRKTSRTFANVTALAQEYPEFVFACSQAQQYAWVKERSPEVYARMQAAAKAGQWVPVGGMWVEADGNLPGGEALVRQFVTGKAFFREEFGVDCQGVWLPDSFGYSGAYPQIARLAGMDWFLTQKISWNQTNKFPHHTFRWEGIDGSQIFTHFPPVDTYNAIFSAEELTHAVANYSEKGRGTRSLAPFGHGDGGGGPTREMLERARRFADLEGAPKVVVQDPNRFFADARAEYPAPPVWAGELYLELHRATYTSQARTKAGNRRSEHLLREAELWATTAALNVPSYAYPHAELDRLWKVVLLHQFHDILPGSSIAWVHREAEQTYGRVRADLEALVTEAVHALGSGSRVLLNTAPHERTEVVGDQLVRVPASGAVVLADAAREDPTPVTLTRADGMLVLANGVLTVVVDADGLLASVVDEVNDREVLAPGARGNLLQLHSDFPNSWDAWDVDLHYRNRVVDLVAADEVTAVEEGPLRARVRVVRSFRASRIVQEYVLAAGSDRLDVRTEIDWHEQEKFLKAAFGLDLHAAVSSSEIQFGHVQRATHTNTSWDHARFETAMHRWVHVAEPGYGVAVANDSTYGHDTTRAAREDGGSTTTVRLSLVRGPRMPDPQADQGRHVLSYSLVPGARIADAVRTGYDVNLPLREVDGPAELPQAPVTVTGSGATLEAVKLAQDGSGDVVVRVYEAWGARAKGVLRTSFPVAEATVVDLLEDPAREGTAAARGVASLLDDGSVGFALRPFEVLSLRLARA